MKSNQRQAIWPYLAILASLFMLSVMAPRQWSPRDERPALTNPQAAARSVEHVGPAAIVRPTATLTSPPELVDATSDTVPGEIEVLPMPSAVAKRVADPYWSDAGAELAMRSERRDITPSPPLPAAPPAEALLDDLLGPMLDTKLQSEPTIDAPLTSPAEPTATADTATADTAIRPAPAELSGEPAKPSTVAAPAPIAVQALAAQLEVLVDHPECGDWARQTLAVAQGLFAPGADRESRLDGLHRLELLAGEATELAAKLGDRSAAAQLLRVRYSLERRYQLWRPIWSLAEVAATNATEDNTAAHSAEQNERQAKRLLACLGDIEALTSGTREARGWESYLMLEALREAAADSSALPDRQALAQQVLDRLDARKLDLAQQKFVQSGPLHTLDNELRLWLAGTIDADALIARLERFEAEATPSDGGFVAEQGRLLRASGDPRQAEIAERLESHYRNANIRLTLAGDLLNRLTPDPQPQQMPVNDHVLGLPVHGTSVTRTELFVRLLPDPQRLRVGLEASGQVHSRTSSSSGPVTLVNQGQSQYLARKLILWGQKGLHVWPAIAQADSTSDLESIHSEFDSIPLVGTLVRNYAIDQREEMIDDADREVQAKVAATACRRIDAEAAPKLRKAEQWINRKVVDPLERLGLEPTALALQTTAERLVMRFRLAGAGQLAAHTPRPLAPSGNMLSLQLEQSVINNALDNLDLPGRTFTLAELQNWIMAKVGKTDAPEQDWPENLTIKFAENAARVRLEDDEARLVLSIAELKHGKNRWRDFQVSVRYRPQVEGLRLLLEREGLIELHAKHYRGKAIVPLRAIFSAVFSPEREVSLLPAALAAHPQLKDLRISQCTIRDGWFAFALSATKPVAKSPEKAQALELEAKRAAAIRR